MTLLVAKHLINERINRIIIISISLENRLQDFSKFVNNNIIQIKREKEINSRDSIIKSIIYKNSSFKNRRLENIFWLKNDRCYHLLNSLPFLLNDILDINDVV
jgi:hypothetical protein